MFGSMHGLMNPCAEAKGGGQVPTSIKLHLVPLRQGLSLNLKLASSAGLARDPPVSRPSTPGFFHRCWGSRLKSSHLLSKSL